ncbi:hypothetical protein F4813DRAFT_359377 [Daldinia decipiens]|uniref:uncharacterized protein n=1 Tax=Daldinia decipiens TaxID=326647 RepID=UPI0020C35931|nr:uncharacterized protein F4813DRAFT_359377 [Daldinia decipiens]KAI1657733.1 hypothetical protein F4813DRAFT_359377 [Daldinia decipiens]
MSSVNHLSEDKSLTNHAGSQPAASGQNPAISPEEPIHPRLDDFIREPLDSGNRNVMLPDRNANVDLAIKYSQERMEKDIENTAKALGKPESQQ